MSKASQIRRWRKDRNRNNAVIQQALADADADKLAHDYDCNIHERQEWGCLAYGICSCGYGDARKMHGDYSELRSCERHANDATAEVDAVFGKSDDGLAGGLESVSAAIAAELTDGHPPLPDSVKDALCKAEEYLTQRSNRLMALKQPVSSHK